MTPSAESAVKDAVDTTASQIRGFQERALVETKKVGSVSVDVYESTLKTFADYRCAVELRHRSWSDEFGSTLKLLNAHDAAFVQIDEPKFKTSIRQNQLPNIKSFYYLRAHGRNSQKWWHHEHKDERYDYLYGPSEIQ